MTVQTKTFLYVEVSKRGVVQAAARYPLRGFFRKNISLSTKKGSLSLPNAVLRGIYPFFRVGRNTVNLTIKSGIKGFVLGSGVFVGFEKLLKDREKSRRWRIFKRIKIQMPLKGNAQGLIHFQGYDLVFKIRNVKENFQKKVSAAKTKPQIQGAGRSLVMNAVTPILEWSEKFSLLFACALTVFVFASALFRLNSETPEQVDLFSLDREDYQQIIHPTHLQYSAGILNTKFNINNPGGGISRFINDLVTRWDDVISGKEYESEETFLSYAPQLLTKDENVLLKQRSKDFFNNFKDDQLSKQNRSRVLKAIPELSIPYVPVSGGAKISLKERTRGHIEKIKELYQAQVVYRDEEFKLLQENFKLNNVKYEKPLTIPKTGQLLYSKPGPEYREEIERFEQGQLLAEESETEKFVNYLHRNDGDSTKTLVLGDDFIYSSDVNTDQRGAEDRYFSNLNLLLRVDSLPLDLGPKPFISKIEVDRFLKSKQSQIGVCYDMALRQSSQFYGKMNFTWKIDVNGRARDFKAIAAKNVPQSFVKCMDAKIKNWNFPRAKNGIVTISYPMEFVVRKER